MKSEILGNILRITIERGDHLGREVVYEGEPLTIQRPMTEAEIAMCHAGEELSLSVGCQINTSRPLPGGCQRSASGQHIPGAFPGGYCVFCGQAVR